ncbi:MAG: hypothetical protein ACFFHV_19605 [Promethearchaeota archaeon]
MTLSIWRFIHIYILFVSIFAFFIFISYNILKRDIRNRLNQVLSLFHICLALGLFITFIYASLSDPSLEPLATQLHLVTIYFTTVSTGFLLLFIILLYKSEYRINSLKNQLLFMAIYFIISLGFFMIPNGAIVPIKPDGTQLYPVWTLSFFLFYFCIITTTLILSLIISKKICDEFKVEILVKKMKLFVFGICCIYYMGFAVGLTNYLNIPLLRNILTLTQAIPILGVILIYFSIGRTLKQPFLNPANQNQEN